MQGRTKAVVTAAARCTPYRGYRWLLYYPPANQSLDELANVDARGLENMSELGVAQCMAERVASVIDAEHRAAQTLRRVSADEASRSQIGRREAPANVRAAKAPVSPVLRAKRMLVYM